jgi:hypothetical protein
MFLDLYAIVFKRELYVFRRQWKRGHYVDKSALFVVGYERRQLDNYNITRVVYRNQHGNLQRGGKHRHNLTLGDIVFSRADVYRKPGRPGQ